MLEFLGFIALIALIFGINFATALGGVIKFIAIGVLVCIVLAIIVKLLETKKGTLFVLFASMVAIIFGVMLINDDYSKKSGMCDTWAVGYQITCLTSIIDEHNEAVNRGWGYAICGTIVGLIAFTTYYGVDDKNNKAKTHSAV